MILPDQGEKYKNYHKKQTMDPQNQNTQTDVQNTDTAAQDTATQNETPEEIKRRTEAILAMEGEEGRLRREQAEKEQKEAEMIEAFETEKTKLNTELAEINKEKEGLEISWIDLSDKKKALEKILEPILGKEAQIEKDEQAKNQEEHATEDPKQRQEYEKERQALEAERKTTEEEKWGLEDKIGELDIQMADNKTKYQSVLAKEYELLDKVKEIEKSIESVKH